MNDGLGTLDDFKSELSFDAMQIRKCKICGVDIQRGAIGMLDHIETIHRVVDRTFANFITSSYHGYVSSGAACFRGFTIYGK